MKYVVCSIFICFLFSPESVGAQERGIGVSPAKIEIEQNVEWPYAVPITVTNFSTEKEQFEVSGIAASPGRFSLDPNASRRVLLTFDPPAGGPRQPIQGIIEVVSLKTSPNGFTTGTGLKIPYAIDTVGSGKFLAAANQATPMPSLLFGIGLILATIILLWYISGIVKPWILNSNKQ